MWLPKIVLHIRSSGMPRFPTNTHSLHACVSTDPDYICSSSCFLNPSAWPVEYLSLSLCFSHPPPPLFLSAEFCVLLVEAPIFHSVQRRRSHLLAKIRWPRVFLPSPRTPMLTVETTRQVECETSANRYTISLKAKPLLLLEVKPM